MALDSDRFRRPSLSVLKAFHAAARHGSIRGAADELAVTPRAVSQHLKRLEKTLQVTLFEQHGRTMESTEAAVLLARFVEAEFRDLYPVLKDSFWSDILEFLDVQAPDDTSVLAFHDAATMRCATLSGMGIGLISRVEAEQDILAGDLVTPLGVDVLDDMPPETVPGFYLVQPCAHRRISVIASFCDWMTGQVWEGTHTDTSGRHGNRHKAPNCNRDDFTARESG